MQRCFSPRFRWLQEVSHFQLRFDLIASPKFVRTEKHPLPDGKWPVPPFNLMRLRSAEKERIG